MAQELDDGEFWLPAEFLTDVDLLTDFKTDHFKSQKQDFVSHGYGSYFSFNSDLSSPVESVNGSTGTESDEDDFISGLTRKMANCTVQSSTVSSDCSAKGWKSHGSPQSTLCGCKRVSSSGCVSQISSPTEVKSNVGWDLLHAAAEEVLRLRMLEDKVLYHSVEPFSQRQKPIPASPAVRNPDSVSSYYPYKSQSQTQLAYLQLQATQYQRMKLQEQMMRRGDCGRGRPGYQFQNGVSSKGAERAQGGLSTDAWPTLQQSHQQRQLQLPVSGPRAVFLGENVLKKERNGTGVFLPRGPGSSPTETRQKTGCSPVLPGKLSPARAHDVKLNLKASKFTSDYDSAPSMSHPSHPSMNRAINLPQEWTY